jgi:hypothetical protein
MPRLFEIARILNVTLADVRKYHSIIFSFGEAHNLQQYPLEFRAAAYRRNKGLAWQYPRVSPAGRPSAARETNKRTNKEVHVLERLCHPSSPIVRF